MLIYRCITNVLQCSVLQKNKKGCSIMADTKELKPKSFRIDDETAERFKEISASIGGSQQETLAKLIEAFEFQQGKAVLTEKKAEIEQFEKYVSCLTRMYMGTLEDNQHITETVRSEFDSLLKSKDAVIQDLQEKLSAAKKSKEEAVILAKTHSSDNESLRKHIERLELEYNTKMDDMQNMLADKESLNKVLSSSCNDLKVKVDQLQAAAEQSNTFFKELEKLKIQYDNLEVTKNSLESNLKAEKEKHKQEILEREKREKEAFERIREQSEFNLEKKVLEIEKNYQEQILKLKEEKQTEIDKYQQKYFNLLEQMEKPKATSKQKKEKIG